jgi:hypothetical protein
MRQGSISLAQSSAGYDPIRRRSSVLQTLTAVAPLHRNRTRAFILLLVLIATLIVTFQATPETTREQLGTLSRQSLQRLQQAALNAAKKAGSWREECSVSQQPQLDEAPKQDVDNAWAFKPDDIPDTPGYPPLLHPPPPGFGVLSRVDNPWRERFLVPLAACNEQVGGRLRRLNRLPAGSLQLARRLAGNGQPDARQATTPSRKGDQQDPRPSQLGIWRERFCALTATCFTRKLTPQCPRFPPSVIVDPTRSTRSTKPSRPTLPVCGPYRTEPGPTTSLGDGDKISSPQGALYMFVVCRARGAARCSAGLGEFDDKSTQRGRISQLEDWES